ncbi:MAG: 1,4-alpha-glucan branching protein GlgB [bacterium]
MPAENTNETANKRRNPAPLSDYDIYLFKKGNHHRLYERLGSHLATKGGTEGARFAVWAPNAERVSVVGGFNGWEPGTHLMSPREDKSGIWETFVPGVDRGVAYKYHIVSKYGGYEVDKGDPFAFYFERPPETASIVWDLDYDWNDREWMTGRAERNGLDSPMSVYELHIGSWRRVPEDQNRPLDYRELAHQLADYVKENGFTHVEFMPVMEHPFYGSWGYQVTGFFAPTSRYGTPQDFMYLVDYLHQNDIGVILDWVPSHFPSNENGLVYFDGTHLYEHADPRKGFHPEWKSYIFNYGRNEVRAFLISSALFWLNAYHVDGLRVDAVASMLYLDYGREDGEWVPNEYGGRENLEAISFLRELNGAVYQEHPDVQTIAEESTAWPMVTRPAYAGGLGFGLKWKMGWMHDTLDYFSKDPVYRQYHHDKITFSIWYAFAENYLLPLSHDEVVYGKGSLIGRMPGDDWQKFANLRVLLGYMYTHPGKKLLFMGGEFGQRNEWYHEKSLDWHLLQNEKHLGLLKWVRALNQCYRDEPSLHEVDFEGQGFEWMDYKDPAQSVVSYIRRGRSKKEIVLISCNFTPVPRHNYRVGVPAGGFWREVLNSDAKEYGGSGQGNIGGVEAVPVSHHGRYHSLNLTLPPMAVVLFKRDTRE